MPHVIWHGLFLPLDHEVRNVSGHRSPELLTNYYPCDHDGLWWKKCSVTHSLFVIEQGVMGQLADNGKLLHTSYWLQFKLICSTIT